MSLSTLPLSYCTNVHPGQTVDEILHGLKTFTIVARERLGEKIAAGLWLPASVVQEIENDRSQLARIRKVLADGDVVCYTLNTFPYGNFHSERVKEQVYLPDWSSAERLSYTASCARILAELMPEGTEGSLSTVPLGFKGFDQDDSFVADCIDQLLALTVELDDLHNDTGKVIRLAIEPEPLCVLETTPETIKFFEQLYETAAKRDQDEIAHRHLGVCFDVCHQSVEFEDVQESIQSLENNDIRINKVHITCAIQLPNPGENSEARSQLAEFAEPRYLHQTFAKRGDEVVSVVDLNQELCESPSDEFASAEMWRIHFHVPVNAETIGNLETTRSDLKLAIEAVRQLDYAPHLEVETYTWNVLPGEEEVDLVESLRRELEATLKLLK